MSTPAVHFLGRPSICGALLLCIGCHAPDVLVTQTDAAADATDAVDPLVEMREVARLLAEVECTQQETCEPIVFAVNWGDRATCVAGLTTLREKRAYGVGTSPMHLSQRRACAAASALLTCDQVAHAAFENDPLPECRLSGTLPDGAGCSWNSQCLHGACSTAVSPVQGCGVCITRQPEGAGCFEDLGCDFGLVCRLVGTAARCVRLRPPGEACGADALCLGPYTCRDGRCVAPLAVGEPCTPDPVTNPCAPPWHPAFCNAKTLRCEEGRLAHVGDPCGDEVEGVPVGCVHGTACKALTEKTGTCVGATADGQACGGAYFFGADGCSYPSTCNGTLDATCGIVDGAHCAAPWVPP